MNLLTNLLTNLLINLLTNFKERRVINKGKTLGAYFMNTIKITDKYFVRIQGRNYVACELVERKNKEIEQITQILVKPSYHVDFQSALEAIIKRMERDELLKPEVQNIHDVLNKLEALSTYVEQLKTVKFDDVSNAEKLLLEEEDDEEIE